MFKYQSEEDEELCHACHGSGLPSTGPIDSGSCSYCYGSGVENYREQKQEWEEARADYLLDELRDRKFEEER